MSTKDEQKRRETWKETDSGLTVPAVTKTEDKRKRGPREPESDNPIELAAQLLAGWAAVLRKDERFMAVLNSLPRNVRRELARRFAYLIVGLRDKA